MTPSEVDYAAAGYSERFKDAWEQTRQICMSIVSTVSTKPLAPTDVLKFSWDNAKAEKKPLTPEERDRIMKKANVILEKIKQKNGS